MSDLGVLVRQFLAQLDDDFLNKKYLLAVSGGSDSVCLFSVFKLLKLRFEVAHCNFQLRGEESDGDEQFIKELVSDNEIKGHFTRFDTNQFAQKKKLSIQEAARELRYGWFAEIQQKQVFDYIVTAHHQDDLVETFFINLTRGTGIKGLKSIPVKNGTVIRPLLNVSKQQVNTYIEKNALKFRNDSSNASLKYSRNFLRHQILPQLNNVHSEAKKGVLKTIENLSRLDDYLVRKIEEDKTKYVSEIDDRVELKQVNLHSFYFVYVVLSQYGFTATQVENILESKEKGRLFYTQNYTLLKDIDTLILRKNTEEEQEVFYFNDYGIYDQPFYLAIEAPCSVNKEAIQFKTNTAYFDASKVKFPLVLRKWKAGDVFQPLGLKGKKKVSDFFTDLKLNRFEKEAVWILESNNQICWIVGMRLDNSFKINSSTTKMIKIVTKLENNT